MYYTKQILVFTVMLKCTPFSQITTKLSDGRGGDLPCKVEYWDIESDLAVLSIDDLDVRLVCISLSYVIKYLS